MNIFVGNISFQSEENDLQSLFEKYGSVNSVKIVSDNFTGRSKGFGFVIMDNDTEAQKAIDELNGYSLQGKNLTVNEARPRTEGQKRPSGGGGGRSSSSSSYGNSGRSNNRW
jgi:RNA recognition motif-containing protein